MNVECLQGVIFLKPVNIEDRVSKEAFERLMVKALKEEKGDITLSPEEANGFLSKRAKKA